MIMCVKNRDLFALIISINIGMLPALAESNESYNSERGNFFASDSARSPLSNKLKDGGKVHPEFFPRTNSLDSVAPPKPLVEGGTPKLAGQDEKDQSSEAALAKLPAKERLVAKYGDPTKNAPILAVENAPKPFQAMMEALQDGEQGVAFEYAKQYVRYLRDFQERNTRVMSMINYAGRREGVLDEKNWKRAPALEEDKTLYLNDLAREDASKLKGAEEDEALARSIFEREIFEREQKSLFGDRFSGSAQQQKED
jgi:hypothetical protein